MMNRRSFVSAVTAAAATGAPAAAQVISGASSLFDGKTLSGWTIENGPDSAFYVDDGAITVSDSADYPAWLRSANEYENFDLSGEFFIKGWIDSGIYIHAPRHGRPTWEGIQIKLFHQKDEKPMSNSMGSLFPLVPPKLVNVKNRGEWNTFRIRMDWPRLQVWTNGETIQDVDLEQLPEFRYRRRKGHIGLASLSYPIRFRGLVIEHLPEKQKWDSLYTGSADLGKWFVSDGKPNFAALGPVLRGDGLGTLATKEKYRDFELRTYIRASKHHNGGVIFRSGGGSRAKHYEIQLHDVEDAHYPTGSLYYWKRATYPKIEPEQWFPFYLRVEGKRCMVRINGDTVMEYDALDNLEEGYIELQAHRQGYWTEYKEILVRRLG